jgi:peroxiredoxin
VRKIYPELQRLGVDVVVISFAPPEQVANYIVESPQPFLVLSDATLAAYGAFGLRRGSLGSMLRPRVIGRYLLHILRGWLPKKSAAGQDVFQLGGDFVFDRDGVLRYAHPAAEPTDRPSAAHLLEQVRTMVSRGR